MGYLLRATLIFCLSILIFCFGNASAEENEEDLNVTIELYSPDSIYEYPTFRYDDLIFFNATVSNSNSTNLSYIWLLVGDDTVFLGSHSSEEEFTVIFEEYNVTTCSSFDCGIVFIIQDDNGNQLYATIINYIHIEYNYYPSNSVDIFSSSNIYGHNCINHTEEYNNFIEGVDIDGDGNLDTEGFWDNFTTTWEECWWEARFDDIISFNGTSLDFDGVVVAYEWNSSIDGLLSNQEDFSITNLSIGNHNITFRAQDNEGRWGGRTVSLKIYPNLSPNATITSINPWPADIEMPVFFNSSSSDIDGVILVYEWNSSIDGLLSIEHNFNMIGLSLGNHTITFRVQDNDGSWSSDSSSIWIYASPVAIPGADLENIEINTEIQFSGAGTDEDGEIVLYEWDFDGDGIFEWSSEENGITTHIYNKAGVYPATLRVTDSDNNTGTDSRRIEIAQGLTSAIPGVIIDEEAGLLIVATVGLIIAIFSRRD